jgi:hypothetical protein
MPLRPSVARRSTDLIAPRTHAIVDLIALPAMLGLAAWAARRNKRAAAIILANALIEGTNVAITKFPGGSLLPLISFRRHVRLGQVGGPLLLALGSFRHVPPPERGVLIFLGLLPTRLNGLRAISDQPTTAT